MNDPNEEDRQKKKSALAGFADSLVNVEKEDKKAKKEILREGIEEREKSDKSAIMSSRMVTGALSDLRAQAGLSAFVGTSGKIKSPRFKRKEFISLLARELLLIGTEELKDKGGIISTANLTGYFQESRENWELREFDINDALEYLKKQKMIPNYEKLNEDIEIIYFKPIELSQDTRKILIAAHGLSPTKKDLLNILGWNQNRLDIGLKLLVESGLAIVSEEEIFFPGM